MYLKKNKNKKKSTLQLLYTFCIIDLIINTLRFIKSVKHFTVTLHFLAVFYAKTLVIGNIRQLQELYKEKH